MFMANLKLTLLAKREKMDKTCPLAFSISVKCDVRYLPIGHSVSLECWDSKNLTLKKTAPAYEALMTRINELYVKYLNKILEYERINPVAGAQEIKDYILCKPKPQVTLESFWKSEVAYLKKANRSGSAILYEDTLSSLSKTCNMQIPFEKVDYTFIKNLEAELVARKLKINSIGVYLRTFRAVYNKAINAGVIGYEYYPFRRYKIRKAPTRPRTLTLVEMQKYFNAEEHPISTYYDSWWICRAN